MSDLKVSDELSYDVMPMLYGKYEHIQVTCQESFTQVTPVSGQTLTWQIVGSNVVNLAESFIEFVLNTTAPGVGFFTWIAGGCIPFFRSAAFMPTSGTQWYCDQFHHWSKMTLPYLTSNTELKTMDSSNLMFVSDTLKSNNKYPANGFNASLNYTEYDHAINIDGGNSNSIGTYIVKLPLSLFAGTILAMNKDVCFGQAVNIQMIIEDPSKWIWKGTSSNDPSAGAVATTGTLLFQNIYLQLAVEQDQAIRQKLLKMAGTGLMLEIPWVSKIYQQSISGTSQNINPPIINKNYGHKLKRIWWAAFNGTETLNTALDNTNAAASPVSTVSTNRIITFQTLFNSIVRQQKYINASPAVESSTSSYAIATQGEQADWQRFRKYFEGSCIMNSNMLGYAWAFADEFTPEYSREQKYNNPKLDEQGYDLIWEDEANKIPRGDCTYQILTTNASATNNWYVYIETCKTMIIANGNVTIQ